MDGESGSDGAPTLREAAAALGRRGGHATAARRSPEERTAAARHAARARWGDKDRAVRPIACRRCEPLCPRLEGCRCRCHRIARWLERRDLPALPPRDSEAPLADGYAHPAVLCALELAAHEDPWSRIAPEAPALDSDELIERALLEGLRGLRDIRLAIRRQKRLKAPKTKAAAAARG